MDAMEIDTAKRCFDKLKELLAADDKDSEEESENDSEKDDNETLESEEEKVSFNNEFTKRVHDSVRGVTGGLTKEDIAAKKWVSLEKGSESRWWSIGVAATILWNDLEWWIQMARSWDSAKVSGATSGSDKARKICQDFLSLASEETIVSDLAFLKDFHHSFFAPHMKYFQSIDKLTKKSGFQSFNVLVRTFLMTEDINALMDVEHHAKFGDFRKSIEQMSESTKVHQIKKAKACFSGARIEQDKMFDRWFALDKLAFLAAFSEPQTGRVVSQHLLGYPICNNPSKTVFDSILGCWKENGK